jgi:hypothetical protein
MNKVWEPLVHKPDTTPPKRGRGRPKLMKPEREPRYYEPGFGTLAERLKKLGLE